MATVATLTPSPPLHISIPISLPHGLKGCCMESAPLSGLEEACGLETQQHYWKWRIMEISHGNTSTLDCGPEVYTYVLADHTLCYAAYLFHILHITVINKSVNILVVLNPKHPTATTPLRTCTVLGKQHRADKSPLCGVWKWRHLSSYHTSTIVKATVACTV